MGTAQPTGSSPRGSNPLRPHPTTRTLRKRVILLMAAHASSLALALYHINDLHGLCELLYSLQR